MSDKSLPEGQSVGRMFALIAQRYDLLNRIMTMGQDRRWRKETVKIACRHQPELILDIGSGTGDLALEVVSQHPSSRVVAVDIATDMMMLGREKKDGDKVQWVVADGLHLPFEEASIDASISAFLVRNLHHLEPVLTEQFRVLVPKGKIVVLDTTPPARSIYKPILNLYLRLWIPLLGRLFAGSFAAYRYLGESTRNFLSANQFELKMREVGFGGVQSLKRMLGVIAIHSGEKP